VPPALIGSAALKGSSDNRGMATPALRIDVWSDYVCPFCYLELPVLDALKAQLDGPLEIEWHAFELRPEPVPTLEPAGEYLTRVWAQSVYPMAAARQMTLRLPPVQPRSRLAFEAAEFARDAGRGEAMHRAIFKAFFEEGRDIGAVEVLAGIAGSLGLDGEALRAALREHRYTGRVVADESRAAELGIRAVPMLAVRREGAPITAALGLSGAAEIGDLRRVVDRVLTSS
jgi:predicted DsbA family dithiol-disulfide isomerase